MLDLCLVLLAFCAGCLWAEWRDQRKAAQYIRDLHHNQAIRQNQRKEA